MATLQDRWGWVVVAAGFLSLVTLGFTVFGTQYFYVELLERYRQSAAVTAGPISIYYSVGFFIGPVASWFIRRFSHRAAAMLGGLTMTLGFFTAGFSGHIAHVYISYFIAGLGYLFVYGSYSAIIPLYFDERRYTALGVIHCGLALGLLLSPYSMDALLNKYGYNGASIITAGICLQNCVTGALLRPVKASTTFSSGGNDGLEQEEPLHTGEEMTKKHSIGHKEKEEEKAEPASVKLLNNTLDTTDTSAEITKEVEGKKDRKTIQLLKNVTFIVTMITVFTILLSMSTFNSTAAAMAKEKDISDNNIAMFLTIVCVFDVICRPLFGVIFDRSVMKPLVCYCYALLALINGVATFLMWFAVSLPLFIVFGTPIFIVRGTLIAQLPGVVSHLFGQDFLLHSLGIVYLAIGSGVVLGPIITGLLKDFFGTFAAGYALNGGLAALGGLLMGVHLLYRRYKHKRSLVPGAVQV